MRRAISARYQRNQPSFSGYLSTPQQKCIGWPEQKYINDAGEQGPELGAFVRHQTWAGLSAGVSELARRERLLL